MPNLLLLLWIAFSPELDPRLSGLEAVEPRVAIALAAAEVGRPDLEPELLRICKRESWCGRYGEVGKHEIDGWAGQRSWERAVDRGWLSPEDCPEHQLGADPTDWSTRGLFGTIAAFALHRLEPHLGECLSPELLDQPGPAALAAAELAASCDHFRGRPCTCEDRTAMWAGIGVWRGYGFARRVKGLERQCGDLGPVYLGGLWVRTYAEHVYRDQVVLPYLYAHTITWISDTLNPESSI